MIEKQVYFERNGIVIEGTTYILPKNEEKGYNFEIAVFVPKNCKQDTTLLMRSCNTGGNVPIHLDEAIKIAEESTYARPNPGALLASELNMPVMIPLIPRIRGYYTQAFGSYIYNNDVSYLIEDQAKRKQEDRLTEEEIKEVKEKTKDLDIQVVSMIKEAKKFLKTLNITVDEKVITTGYSAGSKFANYFTALHPELVKACIVGGTSGLGILPISEYQGVKLNFPLGVADIKDFNYEEFIKVPQLHYIGTEDYNDPAMPLPIFEKDSEGNYIIDENHARKPIRNEQGDVVPELDQDGKMIVRYKENYTSEEFEIIQSLLGTNPQNRFKTNEAIYKALGVDARFERFNGNHQTVNQYGDGNKFFTLECEKAFIEEVLEKEKTL